jgi:predicted DNA-binding ribbon-helix-helix protein
MEIISRLDKRNVRIGLFGERTTIKMEVILWDAFEMVCRDRKINPSEAVAIAANGDGGSRTSRLRTWIITQLMKGYHCGTNPRRQRQARTLIAKNPKLRG